MNPVRRALVSLLVAGVCQILVAAQNRLPPVPSPPGNPITTEKALLGKLLFWDEQLSSSNTVACGTCHRFAVGGGDPRSIAPLPGLRDSIHPGADGRFHTADDVIGSSGLVRRLASGGFAASPAFGVDVQVTARHAPSVVNAAYHAQLFWDGRADQVFRDPRTGAVRLPAGAALESQAVMPILDDVEMGHVLRSWNDVANKLDSLRPLALASSVPPAMTQFVGGRTYGAIFRQVFGTSGVTPDRIAMAIATYERTLISDQTPYDLGALSPEQQRGHALFSGSRARCTTCHREPLLSDTVLRNTGVRPWSEDVGAGQGRFKIPGLRNVALAAPFFHNGRGASLAEVLDFYERGGDFSEFRDSLMQPITPPLNAGEKQDLLAFLAALTDPRVAAELPPFDRPRLYSESARVPLLYGAGTPGSAAFVPWAVALDPPFLGNPQLTLGVKAAHGGSLGFLLLDSLRATSPIPVVGIQLWVPLTAGFLLIPVATAGNGAGGGHGSIVISVPSDQSLRGAQVWGQWVLLDPGGPQGMSASQGLGLTLF